MAWRGGCHTGGATTGATTSAAGNTTWWRTRTAARASSTGRCTAATRHRADPARCRTAAALGADPAQYRAIAAVCADPARDSADSTGDDATTARGYATTAGATGKPPDSLTARHRANTTRYDANPAGWRTLVFGTAVSALI